jgi:hypothetical protein
MSLIYPMYKDRQIEKSKRVMRHIELIRMNRCLFCVYLLMH